MKIFKIRALYSRLNKSYLQTHSIFNIHTIQHFMFFFFLHWIRFIIELNRCCWWLVYSCEKVWERHFHRKWSLIMKLMHVGAFFVRLAIGWKLIRRCKWYRQQKWVALWWWICVGDNEQPCPCINNKLAPQK